MASNLDRSYDGIIIGAGHHGMVLGSYLAKCGLNVLLVDRRLEYGGGLSTKEMRPCKIVEAGPCLRQENTVVSYKRLDKK
jgi:phytoene dehydrogenase-like protein